MVWVALWGCLAALVVGAVLAWLRRDRPSVDVRQRGTTAALAVALFVLPVVVHGFLRWSPGNLHDRNALTPGLIRFLQREVPARSVVLGDLGTSYRITAFAPVYVVAVPPTHAANTWPNELHKRRLAVLRFLVHPTLATPRTWRAGWVVLTRAEQVRAFERQGLRPVYQDRQFVVFRTALHYR